MGLQIFGSISLFNQSSAHQCSRFEILYTFEHIEINKKITALDHMNQPTFTNTSN